MKFLLGNEKMGVIKNQDVQRGKTNKPPLMTLTKNNIRDTQCVKSSWSPVCWVLCSLHFLLASWGHRKPLWVHVAEGKLCYLFHVWSALRHKKAICDYWHLATVSFGLGGVVKWFFSCYDQLWNKKKKAVPLSVGGKVVRGAAVCALDGCPCVRKLSGMQACIHTPSVWINWLWMRRWKAKSGRLQSGVLARDRPPRERVTSRCV